MHGLGLCHKISVGSRCRSTAGSAVRHTSDTEEDAPEDVDSWYELLTAHDYGFRCRLAQLTKSQADLSRMPGAISEITQVLGHDAVPCIAESENHFTHFCMQLSSYGTVAAVAQLGLSG